MKFQDPQCEHRKSKIVEDLAGLQTQRRTVAR